MKEQGLVAGAGGRLLGVVAEYGLGEVEKRCAPAMLDEDTLSAAAPDVCGETILRSQSHSPGIPVAVIAQADAIVAE